MPSRSGRIRPHHIDASSSSMPRRRHGSPQIGVGSAMPPELGNIQEATRSYEQWVRASMWLPVVESELTAKHQQMREDAYLFFRGVLSLGKRWRERPRLWRWAICTWEASGRGEMGR